MEADSMTKNHYFGFIGHGRRGVTLGRGGVWKQTV
jgi:hypothetical protein